MGRGGKNEITDISSPNRFPAQDVWALAQSQGGKLGGAQSRAAAPPHGEEAGEIALMRKPSGKGFLNTRHPKETLGKTQDVLEGLCLPADLGVFWDSPEKLEEVTKGGETLDLSAEATEDGWMAGWMDRWLGGWIDGWLHGWMQVNVYIDV